MKRLELEKTPPALQKFINGLLRHPDVVEVETNGQVLLRILPAVQPSAEGRTVLLEEGRALLDRSRARSEKVPARIIEREVRQALRVVRHKQR
jgi:hypothetical protein